MKKTVNQDGFSLVELIAAMVILSLIAVVITQVMFASSSSAEQREIQESAINATEEALNSMIALSSVQLPNGKSFTLETDRKIKPEQCTETTCDFILSPAPDPSLNTSVAKGVPWSSGYTPPAGFQIQFVRRWNVETFNDELKLRTVTVAITENDTSDTPLSIQSTVVGLNY